MCGFEYEKPSEWCKRMMDSATDGEEAMAYFNLMQMWIERGL